MRIGNGKTKRVVSRRRAHQLRNRTQRYYDIQQSKLDAWTSTSPVQAQLLSVIYCKTSFVFAISALAPRRISVLLAGLTAAQTSGTITGEIKDTNSALLVGVQITAKQD
jgi:hypothetical protein